MECGVWGFGEQGDVEMLGVLPAKAWVFFDGLVAVGVHDDRSHPVRCCSAPRSPLCVLLSATISKPIDVLSRSSLGRKERLVPLPGWSHAHEAWLRWEGAMLNGGLQVDAGATANPTGNRQRVSP